MKITRIHCQLVQLPADEPLAGGPPFPRPFHEFVALDVQTDQGIEGIGYTSLNGPLAPTLKHAVDQLGALVIGEDPLRTEAVRRKLGGAAWGSAQGGVFTLAFSAIDIALWDIRGKALNQSLAMLLGGLRDKVPTYASGALLRSYSPDQVLKSGRVLGEKGFKQMKTQLALPGETNAAREVERMRLLRDA